MYMRGLILYKKVLVMFGNFDLTRQKRKNLKICVMAIWHLVVHLGCFEINHCFYKILTKRKIVEDARLRTKIGFVRSLLDTSS